MVARSHEYLVHRWPRLRRPDDWIPRDGDHLLWVCGGEFYVMGVTLCRRDSVPGCHLVHCRRYGLFFASINRLYPMRGWREKHLAEDAEGAADLEWDLANPVPL